jgi:hypothetical protein
VRRKDLCRSVRAVYILEKRSDVSGPGLEEVGRYRNGIIADSRGFTCACVAVAQAWYAWLVWTQSGHTTWHMCWHWTHGRGQRGRSWLRIDR